MEKKQKKIKEDAGYEVTESNIFEALGLDQPQDLLVRSKLLMEVGDLIERSGFSQHEVAKKLGITQPKVSMLMRGKLSAFSTDTLLYYLSILGCEVEIRLKKPRTRLGIFKHKGSIAVC